MAYEDKKPEPHFTVHITVNEVTPAYRTGGGVGGMQHDRVVEEVINVTVRDTDQSDAVGKAIALLETADGR